MLFFLHTYSRKKIILVEGSRTCEGRSNQLLWPSRRKGFMIVCDPHQRSTGRSKESPPTHTHTPLKHPSKAIMDYIIYQEIISSFSVGNKRKHNNGGIGWRENGISKILRKGEILLLPLKLPGFGGELLSRSFSAHTHAHEHGYYEAALLFPFYHLPIFAIFWLLTASRDNPSLPLLLPFSSS